MNSVLTPLMSSFIVANLRNSPANPCNLRLESEHKVITPELRPDLFRGSSGGLDHAP